jgi:hypothetical protein
MHFPIGENPADWIYCPLPCRKCIGCRAVRARDVSVRAAHEAQSVGVGSFLTLTYDHEHLPWDTLPLSDGAVRWAAKHPASVVPWGGSLRRRDWVLFMKRLRKELRKDGVVVRAYGVGEYGGRTARPHFHACLFGEDFSGDRRDAGDSKGGHPMFTSAKLDRIWGQGKAWINPLGQEVAQYAAKYALKSLGGQHEVRRTRLGLVEVERPFDSLPRGKALGLPWLERFWTDVFPRGLVVLRGGVELPAPLAYMKVCQEHLPDVFEDIRERRRREALQRFEHTMADRLASRETCAIARANLSSRDAV